MILRRRSSWLRSSPRRRLISSGKCPTMPGTRSPAARRSKFPAARARRRQPPRRPAKPPKTHGISGWGRTARLTSPVIAWSAATKQSMSPQNEAGLLRFARNDDFLCLRLRPTPKSHRQQVALGRILPARGRLNVLDGGKIALQLRQQRGIGAALKHFCEKRSAGIEPICSKGGGAFDQAENAQLIGLAMAGGVGGHIG